MRFTLADAVAVLRDMQRQRPDAAPVISVQRGDPDFDWAAIDGCSDGGYPGIDVGQQRDCRIRTTRRDGLHIHWFPDRIELHVDRVDPMRDPIGHALADTKAGEGVVTGGLIGLALAAMSGDGRLIALGAAVGGIAGASKPARAPLVVPLRQLLSGG